MKKINDEFTFGHGAKLRNRLVLAPMTTYSSNKDLTLSKEEERYYNSRSKNMGMVITAAAAVNKNAQAFTRQISIRDERYLDSMTRLAKAIKKEGAKAVVQLHHGGRMNVPGLYPNQDIVCPSPVKANRDYAVIPRELRNSEIYDIIDDFCNATKLAIKSGFDGVELHGANTYLLQQFFSPHSNKRDDEFGGSLEKRMKFPSILIKRIIEIKKKYAKKDFIIGYRFSPEEIENPGISISDTLYLVDMISGKDIDYLHISLPKYNASSVKDKNDPEAIVSKLVKVINNRLPLIGVGGLTDVTLLQDALDRGYSLLAIGGAALADKDIGKHFLNNEAANRVIREEDLLPKLLFERIKGWEDLLKKRGYTIKK